MPLPEVVRNSLRSVAHSISDDWDSLTANNLAEAYSAFFDELKQLMGSATNFTGLSEFLVFRSILQFFTKRGCTFMRTPATGEIHSFSCKSHCHKVICSQAGIRGAGSKKQADVAVLNRNGPIASVADFSRLVAEPGHLEAIIEVKLWLSNGMPDAERLTARLSEFANSNLAAKPFRAVLVHVNRPKAGEVVLLDDFSAMHHWFRWSSFAGNQQLLDHELARLLET